MFRIGIIGCGGISAVHAQVIGGLDNTVLAACADIRPERAQRMAEQTGCKAYADYIRLLDEEKPDAVHLCTPHYLHPAMAMEAARRGIAVLTEKPPAIDREGWETIRQAAQLAPVGICFQNRYRTNVRYVHELMEKQTYGALLGIRAFVTWCRDAGYYTSADWKGAWATEGGGALINQSVHTLDLILGFLGRPDRVEASMADRHLKQVIEVEDTAEIYLRKGTVPALMYASTAYSQDAPVLLELHFEKAVVRLEEDRLEIRAGGEKREIDCPSDPQLGKSYWGAGHKACIADFYRSIEEGGPFRNDPASCETTMDTLFRIYEQAAAHLR